MSPSDPSPPSSTTSYTNLPIPSSDKLSKSIIVRPATIADARALSYCFHHSFTLSHKFWSFSFPPSKGWYDWWVDAWTLSIENDSTVRTFIAIDTSVQDEGNTNGDEFVPEGKIVGFTRWIVPQADGNLHRVWPDLPQGADMDIMGPFFGGMEVNRKELMGEEPHWCLELLGTDISYQRSGIGQAFVKWGCDLADKEDMRVYIDASELGAHLYQNRFGAEKTEPVLVLDEPETFGHFEYWTYIVPRKSQRGTSK